MTSSSVIRGSMVVLYGLPLIVSVTGVSPEITRLGFPRVR